MLKDKVVVIIGGSGLIGKAFVSATIQNHATTINADISKPNLEQKCDFINTDITSQNSLDNRFPNNAGQNLRSAMAWPI